MNGPEHYAQAQHLVWHSKRHTDGNDIRDQRIAELAAVQAQVHATLALTAAHKDRQLDASSGWGAVIAGTGGQQDWQPVQPLDIVFDGPPSHEPGRFVEAEVDGHSVRVGEWIERPDGLWALRLQAVVP